MAEEKKEMRESPRGRSQLSLMRSCPRKWALKYYKGFKSKELINHLTHGSAVHEAQEAFYKTLHQGTEKAVEAMYERLNQFIKEQDPQGKHSEFYTEQKDRAEKSLQIWVDKIGKFEYDIVEVVAIEEEKELTLLNGYKMTVRFDRILRDKETGRIFINDTKTTGSSLEKTIQNYMFHDQPMLYEIAFRQNYPELVDDFEGWRTDCIYSRKTKRGYSLDARRSEVTLNLPNKLKDTLVSYTALVEDIKDRLGAVKEDGVPLQAAFPANFDACLNYGRLCDYHSFCHDIDTTYVPPGNFEIDPWVAKGTVLDSFKEE